MVEVIFVLVLIIIILFLLLRYYINKYNKLKSSKQSQSVIYGKTFEQFVPFTEKFNHTIESFKFIGMPIDGISFEEDGIYLLEFKTNKSHLSEKQKNIKILVEEKKVYFEEIYI